MFEPVNMTLSNKNQKTACAGLNCITELLINFGPKKLDFCKPFFPEVEKASASTNSSIREGCMTFFKEAMKWLGDVVVNNYTQKLKDI